MSAISIRLSISTIWHILQSLFLSKREQLLKYGLYVEESNLEDKTVLVAYVWCTILLSIHSHTLEASYHCSFNLHSPAGFPKLLRKEQSLIPGIISYLPGFVGLVRCE